MEAFNLLKYLRGGGGGDNTVSTDSSTADTTTIVTNVSPHFTDSDSGSGSGSDTEDGPFFDLEFAAVQEDDEDGETKPQTIAGENEGKNVDIQPSDGDGGDDSDGEDEGELKLTFSPNVDRTDANASLSPPNDLFFQGRLVPVEHSSLTLTASEGNAKFPVSLLKSATKFRVLMLKLKKPKANAQQTPLKSEQKANAHQTPQKSEPKSESGTNYNKEARIGPQKKLFTVKLKVEEVKIKSLFSSKGNSNGKVEQKQNIDESELNSSSTKETIQKYLKLVKPLYIRVSKRYGDKLGVSGHLSLSGGGATAAAAAEKVEMEPSELSDKAAVLSSAKSQKQGNLLRVVPKNLMKSRSASSAAVVAAPVPSQRRDDSLIQQHDGIQGAILHCKRSFNSSRDSHYDDPPATQSNSSSRKP